MAEEDEYADDFEAEDEPAPLPPPPVVQALRPPAPEPGVRPMSAKHGRRGIGAPVPPALPAGGDEAGAEVIRTSAAGAAKPWTEIGWDELELGDVFAVGGSGEIRVALWRGRRVAAKSLFAARSRLSSDQEAWRKSYDEYMNEILTMSSMAQPHILRLHGAVMQPDVGRCAMVLELAECSLFELLHGSTAQLLNPAAPSAPSAAGEPLPAALCRPSACRALAQMLGCEPALAAASDETVLAALSALGAAGCSPTLFDRRAVLRLVAQIASALAYAHALVPSIVHRDVKSHNILLFAETQADSQRALATRQRMGPGAGAAGRAGAGGGEEDADAVSPLPQVRAKLADWGLVGTGYVDAGTPAYMAPELFRRGAFSKSVDVYALGLVMWEAWSAEVPFDSYEPNTVKSKVLAGDRPALPATMPSALEALVVACWDESPQRRPSAADAAERLYAIADRMPPQAPRVTARRGGGELGPSLAGLPAQLAGVGLSDSLDVLLR